MKKCPLCNKIYDDNYLNFCEEDGTPLISYKKPQEQTSSSIPSVQAKSSGKGSLIFFMVLFMFTTICFWVAYANKKTDADMYKYDANRAMFEQFKINEQLDNYDDWVVIPGEFYSYDSSGETFESRPFVYGNTKNIYCEFKIINKNHEVLNTTDNLTVKIIETKNDYTYTFTPGFDFFVYGNNSGYMWDRGYYIVQWLYDKKIICERSFYVN